MRTEEEFRCHGDNFWLLRSSFVLFCFFFWWFGFLRSTERDVLDAPRRWRHPGPPLVWRWCTPSPLGPASCLVDDVILKPRPLPSSSPSPLGSARLLVDDVILKPRPLPSNSPSPLAPPTTSPLMTSFPSPSPPSLGWYGGRSLHC